MDPLTNDDNTNPTPATDGTVNDTTAAPMPDASAEMPVEATPGFDAASMPIDTPSEVPSEATTPGSVTEPTISVSAPIADDSSTSDEMPMDLPAVDPVGAPDALPSDVPAEAPVETPTDAPMPSSDSTPTPDPTSGAF